MRSIGLMSIVLLATVFHTNAHAVDRPDAWITADAKIALIAADEIRGLDVNVDTTDGRVTLHGVVGSQREKDVAERLAREVSGVREVRNLLQIATGIRRDVMKRADDQLEKDVRAALDGTAQVGGQSHRNQVGARRSRVARRQGGHGQRSPARAHGCEPGERRETGRNPGRTANEFSDIELWDEGKAGSAPEGDGIEDAWITTKVKLRFMSDADVPVLDVNVDTRDGAVTLFGTVATEAQKQAATLVTKQVDGVTKVENRLQVVPPSGQEAVAVQDADLRQEVEQRLHGRKDLESDNIKVEVENGVIRLSGTVDSQTDRFAALTAARITRGARAVVDDSASRVSQLEPWLNPRRPASREGRGERDRVLRGFVSIRGEKRMLGWSLNLLIVALGALGLEWAGVNGTQTVAKVLGAVASLLLVVRLVLSNTRRPSI